MSAANWGYLRRLLKRPLGVGGNISPTNLTLPAITGSTTDGTAWTFDIGTWSGTVTQFYIQVQSTDATPVLYLAKTAVSSTTTGTIAGAVGKTLALLVYADNGTSETVATSAGFGPIVAATDTFVLGLALAQTTVSLPTSPYPFTGVVGTTTAGALYPQANPNTGMSGLNYGWNSSANIGATNLADSRLKGYNNTNAGATSVYLRIDLPGAGNYVLYFGAGYSSVVLGVNFGVWDGLPAAAGSGTPLLQLPITSTVATTNVVDASGAAVSVTNWAAAAGPGMGTGVTVSVGTDAFITIGRSVNTANGTPGTPYYSSFAVFKKAA